MNRLVIDVHEPEVDRVADVGRAVAGDAVAELVMAQDSIPRLARELHRLRQGNVRHALQ